MACGEARTVSIDGAVVNEGTYELLPGWKLDDLIRAAGKLTIFADVEHLELRRQGEKPRIINLVEHQAEGSPKLVLKPNDHVIVPTFGDAIKLTGGISNPGLRPLRKGSTIRQFLLNDTTDTDTLNNTKIDLGKAKLFRGEDPAIRIDLRRVLANPKDKRNLVLQNGDTLFLPPKEPRTKGGFFTYLRGMCAAHNSEGKTAASHPRHGGNAKMGCCIPVSCHEVGNRGFFTQTCTGTDRCNAGSCYAGHGKHDGRSHP